MPNWVSHRVTVTGGIAEVERFKAKMITYKTEERQDWWPADRQTKAYVNFEFEAIVPMPQVLRTVEDGTHAEEGMALIRARGGDAAPFDTLGLYDAQIERIRAAAGLPLNAPISAVARVYLAKYPEVEAKGMTMMKALVETGYTSWYTWSVENWGTKWGACHVAIVEDLPGRFEFSFDTAWSYPQPIFAALIAEFPTIVFDITLFDEGHLFAALGQLGGTNDFHEIEKDSSEWAEAHLRVYGRAIDADEDEGDELAA